MTVICASVDSRMADTGIQISIVWTDEHLLELLVKASNGVFGGECSLYAGSDDFKEFAAALRGFLANAEDIREFELGIFDPEFAGGGARFRFTCIDAVGHAFVQVKLRTDRDSPPGVSDSVVLNIPIEAAAVDRFVLELERVKPIEGQGAKLQTGAKLA